VRLSIPTAILDWAQLRDITLNDGDLMRQVVAALIDETTRQIQQLDLAIQERNADLCMRLAHYSKGACANVGAASAAAILKQIEGQAANRDFQGCQAGLLRLAEEVERLRSAADEL
jgi:HPt (histidine-containing phosphotransfer) domain-containing protein